MHLLLSDTELVDQNRELTVNVATLGANFGANE